MLKDTTCETKRYHLKTYLALANVPMWYYGFKPCFWSYKFSPLHRLIHNPLSSLSRIITTCRPLPFVNYYDLAFGPYKLMLAFGPLNSPPLESNTEKEDISSTREGQTL